jgi:hypothetical protein
MRFSFNVRWSVVVNDNIPLEICGEMRFALHVFVENVRLFNATQFPHGIDYESRSVSLLLHNVLVDLCHARQSAVEYASPQVQILLVAGALDNGVFGS